MDPLRIHVIRTKWSHWGEYSGITRYFDYLDRTVFAIHDVPTFHDDESVPHPRRHVWEWMRSRVRRRGMPWYTLYDLQSEIAAAGRIVAGAVDVLHYLDPEHGMQYVPSAMRLAPTRWRPAVVATFHQPPRLLPLILRRDVVRLLDHVTLVSPDQASCFEACLPSDRISIILHGIDTSFFVPPRRREPSADWICVTVGHNLRDFGVLRRVAGLLRGEKDIRFEVVASGLTGVEDMPNVRVRSGLTDREFLAMYQAADVLFLPLKDATANNAMLEGFACGLPTVITDLPAIRAYAPGNEALMVRDNDPAAFADAIIGLRDDAALSARMSGLARQRALELSWERIAPAYARVYRAVSAGARSTTSESEGEP